MAQNEPKPGRPAQGGTQTAAATAIRPTTGSSDAVDRDRVKAQMRRWQDRVLDLTKSNPLIGLNRSRVAKLAVVDPSGDDLFNAFVVEEKQLSLPLVRKRKPQAEQPSLEFAQEDQEFTIEPGDLEFEAKPLDLMRRLRRIHDNARTTLEERGVTTLYMTFGTLSWKDEVMGESVSPLWMVPCEFESKGPDAPLRLCVADEDAQINPALEYYLRERHKIPLPEMPEEPGPSSLAQFLQEVRSLTVEQQWTVNCDIWFSTFSFESLVIYRDLRALVEAAVANPVIAALARASSSSGQSEALPHGLDSLPTPSTVPIPVLSTDSSQLEALALSSLGRHVVVHGPPGTGKSQTITNLIADALSRNKRCCLSAPRWLRLTLSMIGSKNSGCSASVWKRTALNPGNIKSLTSFAGLWRRSRRTIVVPWNENCRRCCGFATT